MGANESEKSTFERATEVIRDLARENKGLSESLAGVMNMLPRHDSDRWLTVMGGSQDDLGFTLEELKQWSRTLRTSLAGNPHMSHGAKLRASYVYSGGVHYENIPAGGKGRGVNVQALIDDPVNQEYFFSRTARRERIFCEYTDGQVFYVGVEGDGATPKRIERIPLARITADYRNPRNPEEIWAYRHSWTQLTGADTVGSEQHEWIFRNQFWDKRTKSIRFNGELEPVAQDRRMFGRPVNRQVGFGYGVPDALAAYAWIEMYRDILCDGATMTAALASLAYTVTTSSRQGGENASLVIGGMEGAGGTYVQGMGNQLQPVNTAGKGYDFDAARAVLAAAAAALEVSVVALSSDPGAAGSSYGSAQTLDLPGRLAIEDRREQEIDLDVEVLKWLGAKDPLVWFDPLEDATSIYRRMQALALKWNTGLVKPEAVAKDIVELFGDMDEVDVPDGVLIPNNKFSWERNDIDPKFDPNGGGNSVQAGGAGQGQSNGTGGQGGGFGDVAEALATDDIVSRLMEAIERLEK